MERAEQFAKRHGIPKIFGSYEEVLASRDIDAVYISLPTHLHGEWARRAFAAGKHVLVEKPICQNAAEGKQLHDLVRNRTIALRDAIANGTLASMLREIDAERSTPRHLDHALSVPTIFEHLDDEDDEPSADEGHGDELDFGGQDWVVEVEEDEDGSDDDFPFLEDQTPAMSSGSDESPEIFGDTNTSPGNLAPVKRFGAISQLNSPCAFCATMYALQFRSPLHGLCCWRSRASHWINNLASAGVNLWKSYHMFP